MRLIAARNGIMLDFTSPTPASVDANVSDSGGANKGENISGIPSVGSSMLNGGGGLYQVGGGEKDMFKIISRIIPMQIDDFKGTPQNMVVTITKPKLMPPFCNTSEQGTIFPNASNLVLGDSDKTKQYISACLSGGQVKIRVGDVVEFIFDGKPVKAIICFFKSGKFKYGTDGTGYEAASNIRDYYTSMKKPGMYNAIQAKEKEPLNLMSLINLRGFAYLPLSIKDDRVKILYDCKSELQRLHNGYNDSDAFKKRFESIKNTLTPGSTEFNIEEIGDIKFSTDSLLTLKNITEQNDIAKSEQLKNFGKFLRSDAMGNSDEETITQNIQRYIQQYGLSKTCGKTDNQEDINKRNYFQQKVNDIDQQFKSSDAYNVNIDKYNVYKSNNFIQSLLSEKITDDDALRLFSSKYNPKVPDLIFWFFTQFAHLDINRAMIMVFQAFARDNNKTGFNTDELTDLPKKEEAVAGEGEREQEDQGGGSLALQEQGGGKWIRGEEQFETGEDGNEESTGEYEWKDDVSGAIYRGPDGEPVYQSGSPHNVSINEEGEEIAANDGTVTDVNHISTYIDTLITIVKENELYDSRYLNILISALKSASS
jgi:hypothetical protein